MIWREGPKGTPVFVLDPGEELRREGGKRGGREKGRRGRKERRGERREKRREEVSPHISRSDDTMQI